MRICEENGLVRSMSGKGCSPDNARCEGYFGRLRMEFFYGCDWGGVTLEESMGMLDAHPRWHGDARIRSDLGYRSPMAYRRDLGLAAWVVNGSVGADGYPSRIESGRRGNRVPQGPRRRGGYLLSNERPASFAEPYPGNDAKFLVHATITIGELVSQACDPSIVRELAKALECEADGMELAATDPKEEYDIW